MRKRAAISRAAKSPAASASETLRGGNGRTPLRIFARASSSLIIVHHFNWQLAIGNEDFFAIFSRANSW
jgi:hypothetical protein